ncbi:hypothetical protein FHR29_000597 [Sphingobacterium sp. JUb56]|nr:hypothetical protein [Sphingobacterium sp. JUb56]
MNLPAYTMQNEKIGRLKESHMLPIKNQNGSAIVT